MRSERRKPRWQRASPFTAALAALGLADLSSQGYLIQVETAYTAFRNQLRIIEVPIIFYERRIGDSKVNVGVIWEAALGVLTLRFRRVRTRDRSHSASQVQNR